MSYILPHLRKASQSNAANPEPGRNSRDGLNIRDIQFYYWPQHDEGSAAKGLPQHSTLNDSAASQGLLRYVLLFNNANPRWEAEKIIFVKSNLDILPQYCEAKAAARPPIASEAQDNPKEHTGPDVTESSATRHPHTRHNSMLDQPPIEITPTDPKPIAVFHQAPRTRRHEGFEFLGYFTVENIALLAPHSKELTRMLEQKWLHADKRGNAQMTQRSASAWQESLGYEWAVIKFAKIYDEDLTPPKIEKAPERSGREKRPTKLVNELLAELRLGKDCAPQNRG